MPKSGCTSLLWLLAHIAGYREARFHGSVTKEVVPSMTVHDIPRWGERHMWSKMAESRRARIARDDTWLRFTTVRHPASRLWSAWQSKLLLREPGSAERFSDEPWWPRKPHRADDIVTDFRAFVRALGSASGRPVDVHWAPQGRILEAAPPMTHVGHAENMDETLAVLAKHLGEHGRHGLELGRENRSLLPYTPALYDEETAEVVTSLYAEDFEEFDYPLTWWRPTDDLDAWLATAAAVLTAVYGFIERHERIGRLQPLALEAAQLRRRNEELTQEIARLSALLAQHGPQEARPQQRDGVR